MKTNQPIKLRAICHAVSLAIPIFASMTSAHAETQTDFATGALAGASISYPPNVALALSVEFPTAGVAYSDRNNGAPRYYYNQTTIKNRYIGYFDNTKCYTYVPDPADSNAKKAFDKHYNTRNNGTIFQPDMEGIINEPINERTPEYFQVSGNASDTAQGVGLCSGEAEFSGNMLNWATMSAIDIFRQAMTGGNRAATLKNDAQAYESGDTTNATYLRRANVQRHKNSNFFSRRFVHLPKDLLEKVLPHAFAKDYNINDFVGYRPNDTNDYYQFVAGSPNSYYSALQKEIPSPGNYPIIDVANIGFTVHFRRLGQIQQCSGTKRSYPGLDSAGNYRVPDNCSRWTPRGYTFLPTTQRYMPYHVVVKACDQHSSNSSGTCSRYPNNQYKPTGLMQSKADSMRFAAFGYANIDGNNVDGGILRARMKSLLGGQTNTNITLGKEINEQTGQFIINPDDYDAKASKVSNSGVINYLNKFGDYGGYKTNDPAAELYYTAQRYLRNAGFPSEYKRVANADGSNRKTLSEDSLSPTEKDNFPVIMQWENPLIHSKLERENACRPNQIILIGDTFTHHDGNLPNLVNSTVRDNDVQTGSLLSTILREERLNGHTLDRNWGANNSPAGLAALAFWGQNHDIQPTGSGYPSNNLRGTQTINTFMIDVIENGYYRDKANVYYLAAKYGGFTDDKNISKNKNITPYTPLPDVRSEWTDDQVGQSSIREFSDGVPRTFAIANSPENMVNALNNALNSVGGAEQPTQSNITLDVPENRAIDLSTGVGILQSTFTENSPIYSGSLIKHRLTQSFVAGRGVVPYIDSACSSCWNAGEKLNNTYHNSTGWQNRNVYTMVNNVATQFKTANATTLSGQLNFTSNNGRSASDLIAYILGNDQYESAVDFRTRNNYLMGTIINSSPTAIRPTVGNPTGPQGVCAYDKAAQTQSRKIHYAVAANDGMLHVFNDKGAEVFAYLPNVTLPKLSGYASYDYIGTNYNRWLNDGTAAVSEVCDSTSKAHSILVGTTGRGGNGVYALDVTNLNNPGANNVLWEFSHPDLGLTIPEPIITHDNDGNPIAIISSGYRSKDQTGSNNGYIFVLKNIHQKHTTWVEGSDYYKIPLGSAGVGEMFAYHNDGDNSVDAIYVGDLEGKVWKLNKTNRGFTRAYGGKPLFKADAAIVGAPYVQKVNGNIYVVFATGRFFGNNDLPTPTRSFQNYAYGILENKINANAVTSTEMLVHNGSNLLEQQFETNTKISANDPTIVYNTISNNQFVKGKEYIGWRLKFTPNMLNVGQALIRGRKVAQFTTITPDDGTKNICTQTGSTSSIIVDLHTGGRSPQQLFDTNGDGLFDSKDGNYSVLTQYDNIAPKSKTFNTTDSVAITVGFGSAKSFSSTSRKLQTDNVVTRLSWREIF